MRFFLTACQRGHHRDSGASAMWQGMRSWKPHANAAAAGPLAHRRCGTKAVWTTPKATYNGSGNLRYS